jgi:ubiquitin-protein ligase
MIEFNCPNCRKRFNVPDGLVGRAAKCRACGTILTVPAQSTPADPTIAPEPQPVAALSDPQPKPMPKAVPPPPPAPAARIPMRTRRLLADAQHMAEAFAHSDLVTILETRGNPPDLYRVEYHVASLGPTDDPEQPAPQNVHQVEIQLTSEYPRSSPKCKMLTPIYHPNIDPTQICVGDHWAAGERLVDLVIRIGEMLAYQAYNIKSPLDAHAAMWADLNADKLPTDPRTIRPAELG